MNIVLLILGVALIIISIILITINANRTYQSTSKIEVEKEVASLDIPIGKNTEDKNTDNFDIDFKEKYFEKEIVDSVEISEFEQEYKFEKPNIESSGENITDEIIKMHKAGLTSNEIAKKLNKGIREIDIIIKVNNGNY